MVRHTANRWVDELLPRVAVRQWVLTVPWPRRWLLARKPALARGVHKVAMQEIQKWMRESPSMSEGCGGHVTVIQRFGSAFSLNLHFHALVLDGLYVPDPRTGGIKWVRSPSLTQEAVEKLVVLIAERAEAFLAREGYGPEECADEDDSEDAAGVIAAAAVAGRSAVSGGRRARRVQRRGGREYKLPHLCASFEGYNLHAGVVIPARDREGLRRLCRYIARPPLAKDRLSETPEGRVRIELKRPWSDGSTSIELTRIEFLERLVAQVPPPRAHSVLYGGVLAARSKLRVLVVPPKPKVEEPSKAVLRLTRRPVPGSRWVPWAELLRKTFSVDPTLCPHCNVPMKLRAVVMAPATIDVLASLDRSVKAVDAPRRSGGPEPPEPRSSTLAV